MDCISQNPRASRSYGSQESPNQKPESPQRPDQPFSGFLLLWYHRAHHPCISLCTSIPLLSLSTWQSSFDSRVYMLSIQATQELTVWGWQLQALRGRRLIGLAWVKHRPHPFPFDQGNRYQHIPMSRRGEAGKILKGLARDRKPPPYYHPAWTELLFHVTTVDVLVQ